MFHTKNHLISSGCPQPSMAYKVQNCGLGTPLIHHIFLPVTAHSPDNSFMGFVVEQHLNESEIKNTVSRSNNAVVYGKAEYMWQVGIGLSFSLSYNNNKQKGKDVYL